MKHTTIRSVNRALSLVASLVIASGLGSSALAGQSRILSTQQGKVNVPFWMPNSLAAVYQVDDGSSENSVGFGNSDAGTTSESLWFNAFDVIPGQNTIASVDIAWGTPTNSNPPEDLNGKPVTIAIWSDPNGDGNPNDAVLLGTVDGTVQNANTDTFVTYTFPTPITVNSPGFFVGDKTPADNSELLYFQAIDQDTTARQSWIAANSTGDPVDIAHINAQDLLGVIDDFGLPGNWLVRANPSTGGGTLNLESASSGSRRGDFTVPLPLTGNHGIEDRLGGDNGKYTIRFTFNNNITDVADASTSCGAVQSVQVENGDAHVVDVNLFGLKRNCDRSDITVTVNGVTDDQGGSLDSASVTFTLRIGDATADNRVNTRDVREVKSHRGEPADATNFRSDINADGFINASDVHIVQDKLGGGQ